MNRTYLQLNSTIYCFPEWTLLFYFHFSVYLSTRSHWTIFQFFSYSGFSRWVYYCYLVDWMDLLKNRLHIFHICLFQSSAADHQLNEHFHFLVCFFYHIRLLDTTNQPLFRSKFLSFLYSGIENLRVTQVIFLSFSSNFSTP